MEYKKLNGLIRQINHLLNNGKGISTDVKYLLLAVMLRFDELARLSDQETQETLEPYADSSGGDIQLGWRPYGSAEAQAVADGEEPLGIRSGALQGFGLMGWSAIRNWKKLLETLKGQTEEDTKIIDELELLILTNPAGAREVVTKWLEVHPSRDPAMLIHNSNLGGIDLNTDLFNLTILNNENHHVPYSFYDANFSLMNIVGISPKIIHDQPSHLPMSLEKEDKLRDVS